MNKKIESIKFNLTHDMSLELIRFNKLKKEIDDLKKLYNLDKNENLLKEICEKENEINECRNSFITRFRKNNYNEIIEYNKIKDQN